MRVQNIRLLRALPMILAVGCLVADIGVRIGRAANVTPTDEELATVTKQFASDDDGQIAEAKAKLRGWLAQRHCPTQLSATWLPSLMTAKRYQDVVDLSLEGLMGQPFARNVGKQLDLRAKAYLALNKPQEALVAAKACFNECEIKEMEHETTLVCQCLVKRYPEDAGIDLRFRAELARGLAAPRDPAAPKPASVLDAVKVDPAVFKKGLDLWKARANATGAKFLDKIYYGNLLLASGRPEEAEKMFRDMYTASTGADRTSAADAVARALRAQDGNLGRANAWLASVPKEEEGLP